MEKKTKKMSYREMRAMLNNFNKLSKQEQEDFAKLNNVPVTEVISRLQKSCYTVCRLTITQKKSLRKEISRMNQEEIEVIERINNMPCNKIVDLLDNEIAHYDSYLQKKRAFNKAWELKKKEVTQQLIDEGKIQVHDGYITTDIFLLKELSKAQEELAKEFGL